MHHAGKEEGRSGGCVFSDGTCDYDFSKIVFARLIRALGMTTNCNGKLAVPSYVAVERVG